MREERQYFWLHDIFVTRVQNMSEPYTRGFETNPVSFFFSPPFCSISAKCRSHFFSVLQGGFFLISLFFLSSFDSVQFQIGNPASIIRQKESTIRVKGTVINSGMRNPPVQSTWLNSESRQSHALCFSFSFITKSKRTVVRRDVRNYTHFSSDPDDFDTPDVIRQRTNNRLAPHGKLLGPKDCASFS